MKHLHTLLLVAVAAALSVMAGLSKADMSAARRHGPHEPQHGVDGNSGVRRSDNVGMSISVHRQPRAVQLPHPGRQSGRPRGI